MIVVCLVLMIIAAAQRLRMREFKEVARLFRYGERRRRPPRYRAMLVRNTLPLLERCDSIAALQALLEEVRKDLGFETLQIRFRAEALPAILNGVLEIEVKELSPVQDPGLVRGNGVPSWTGKVEILGEERGVESGGQGTPETSGRMRVLGEVVATKPAWKRRRASETDDELLQFLADGLATWIAAHSSPRPVRKPRVLVAEDDPRMRSLLQAILRDAYEVIPARNDAEAMATARDQLPDLILLDLNGPRPNGDPICRALKADPRTQHVPLIMLTSLTDVVERGKGTGNGADDYIAKPFDAEELKARVRKALRRT
jgi:CheY-like chemotaxis protein